MFDGIKIFTIRMIAGANVASVILMMAVGYSDHLSPEHFALLSTYNPQNEMFSHFGMKRYNFKNETQLFKVIPHTSKIQKNRPASPERNTFEGS